VKITRRVFAVFCFVNMYSVVCHDLTLHVAILYNEALFTNMYIYVREDSAKFALCCVSYYDALLAHSALMSASRLHVLLSFLFHSTVERKQQPVADCTGVLKAVLTEPLMKSSGI
jgi:hypothetical protein